MQELWPCNPQLELPLGSGTVGEPGLLPLRCPSSRLYLELFKEQAAVLAE